MLWRQARQCRRKGQRDNLIGTTKWHPECYRGFPSGAVGKNPSANAGDMGLIPGVGRFHMRSN